MYKKLLLTIAILTGAVSAYGSSEEVLSVGGTTYRASQVPDKDMWATLRLLAQEEAAENQRRQKISEEDAKLASQLSKSASPLVQKSKDSEKDKKEGGQKKNHKIPDSQHKSAPLPSASASSSSSSSSSSANSGEPSHITLEGMGMIDLSIFDPETKAQFLAQWRQEQATLALVKQLSGGNASSIKGKSELEEKDSDMAQRLANEEQAQRLLQRQKDEEDTRVYLAALSIQAEDAGTHHPQRLANKDLRDAYVAYTKAFNAFKENEAKHKNDVHQFNAAMNFKVLLPLITAQDTLSKADTALDTIIAELTAACKEIDTKLEGDLATNLGTLKGHITTNAVEAGETGANVLHLFSRVWSLAKGDKGATRTLIQTLCDNSQTGGGCYPGHAGRLAQLYVAFLRQQFANL